MTNQHTLANSFLYEHCDVPPGMTLQAWRREAVKSDHRSRSLVGRFVRSPRDHRRR
jgi:hypothetical protein